MVRIFPSQFPLIHKLSIMLFLTGIGLSSLEAAPKGQSQVFPEMGPIAYINAYEGRDAIFIRDAAGENTIFNCDFANEIILTPSVSPDGKFITFVVDNGQNQKAVHILGPIQKLTNAWHAKDLIIMTVRGGAWPVFNDKGSVYLSMPDQTSLVLGRSSNIYLISRDEIKQISDNQGLSSHIWPVISPDGQALIYRDIPQMMPNQEFAEPIKSVLLNLDTGKNELHFVDQYVFVEQWTQLGEILFSFKEKDQLGNRIYVLYNPETKETREIYRHKSRQGALSSESRFLATIRPVPEGSAQFDIFITDLISNTEMNLTSSPRQSESLIGWIR